MRRRFGVYRSIISGDRKAKTGWRREAQL